jgi:hypothetical protein
VCTKGLGLLFGEVDCSSISDCYQARFNHTSWMRMWRMQLPRHRCNTATSTTLTQRPRCLCKAVSMPQCVKRSAKRFHRSTYSYTSLPSPSALSTEHIGQRVTFGLHEVARTFAPGNQLIQAYRICPGILAITVVYPDRASKSSLQDVYQAHEKMQLDQTKMYTICCKHLILFFSREILHQYSLSSSGFDFQQGFSRRAFPDMHKL